ncbi:regulator [Vibrio cholerae]|nr:regulator [Vibrio cholerae]
MYTNNLIDAYKSHMNFVQYKQVAHQLGLSPQMLADIRNGRAHLKENLALIIADEIGEDKEKVLIGLAADRAKSPEEQAIWQQIAKKYKGLSLQGLSMAYVGIALYHAPISQCVLGLLMVNVAINSNAYKTSAFGSFINESKRNDKEFCFS